METESLNTDPRFQPGQSCTTTLLVSDELVHAYADVTGDHNPIHVDDAFAAKSPFHRRIAHGSIEFGFVSKVLGNDLPGIGTIFLSQTIAFRAPVFPGETITLVVTIEKLLPRNGAVLSTVITKDGSTIVADGSAEVKLPLPNEHE
jgi:3-hydroxybutyryl-CoA dehydratase